MILADDAYHEIQIGDVLPGRDSCTGDFAHSEDGCAELVSTCVTKSSDPQYSLTGGRMQELARFDARSYNTLLPIAAANRALTQLGEEEVVGRLLTIIARAGLEDQIGIRLLHKHNDIGDNEVMYETGGVDVEGFALTTMAVPCGDAKRMIPNSWQLVGNAYMPVEFSHPELVADPTFSMSEHAEVFAEIARALRETEAKHLVGPCLHYGRYVKRYDPYEKSALLEKTDSEHRANVVRFVEWDDVSLANSAKTKWRAVQVLDAAGGMVWTTACNCFCSRFPNGKHQGTKTHRYSPSPDEPDKP